jgi:ribosomal protein S27AE
MRCANCKQDILQSKPEICPYCKGKKFISDEEFESQELGKDTSPKYVNPARMKIGTVGSISMKCPHCGASQLLASKSNEVVCSRCHKSYGIPKRVFDLL